MKRPNVFQRVFDWRVRGLRGVNVIGVVLVGAMVFSVYLAKADAAGESARIAGLERDIRANTQRVRLLRAEVARLENPSRLETLSRQAGLAPVDVRRRTGEEGLAALAPPEPAPAPASASEVETVPAGEGAQ